MNILESIIYGLISGLSEFLPISSLGHQRVLKTLFDAPIHEPILDFMVHIGFLIAIFFSCGTYIEKIRRILRLSGSRRRQIRNHDYAVFHDIRYVKNAAFPLMIGLVVFLLIERSRTDLKGIALLFLINGIFMYIPDYLPQSNKDSRKLSNLDGFLAGLLGSLAAFPGISRVGMSLSTTVSRGADKSKAYNWILILSIPAIVLMLLADLIILFQVGLQGITLLSILGYLISGLASFGASLTGIYLMRFIVERSGFSAFAFYSWGAALIALLLYLSV